MLWQPGTEIVGSCVGHEWDSRCVPPGYLLPIVEGRLCQSRPKDRCLVVLCLVIVSLPLFSEGWVCLLNLKGVAAPERDLERGVHQRRRHRYREGVR